MRRSIASRSPVRAWSRTSVTGDNDDATGVPPGAEGEAGKGGGGGGGGGAEPGRGDIGDTIRSVSGAGNPTILSGCRMRDVEWRTAPPAASLVRLAGGHEPSKGSRGGTNGGWG